MGSVHRISVSPLSMARRLGLFSVAYGCSWGLLRISVALPWSCHPWAHKLVFQLCDLIVVNAPHVVASDWHELFPKRLGLQCCIIGPFLNSNVRNCHDQLTESYISEFFSALREFSKWFVFALFRSNRCDHAESLELGRTQHSRLIPILSAGFEIYRMLDSFSLSAMSKLRIVLSRYVSDLGGTGIYPDFLKTRDSAAAADFFRYNIMDSSCIQ